ncbi:MAG: ABC transporter substrate-binding protein [Spirochaetaceae bacterium]|nr:ABC transporter substrate-binding protein [Spirochaetaceae bacterium]
MIRHCRPWVAALIGFVLAATAASAAPAGEEAAAAADKPMVTDPTTGMQVTAPEYGGTLTYPYKLFGETTDPHITGHYAGYQIYAVNEKLAKGDWGAPRDEVSFTGWYVPFSRFKGHLAESWEQPDDRTLIVEIKPDIRWHDKPPVNGRELTAEDVAFTYRRMAGMLDFEPRVAGEVEGYPWESIEALDRYTVEFKLTEPRAGLARAILGQSNSWILPPEVIEQHGDYSDWRNVVGTGPFTLTDYVEGVSITRTRIPNYHDFDEKYPDNRLPYVDELKGLFMPEEATRLAAFRTGQVDMIHVAGGGVDIKTFEVIESVLRTNPDIQVGPYFLRALGQIGLNTRTPPFDDIRVRQAMQMAIDREAVNESYYGGYALWKPQGIFGNATGPYFLPFDEWPKELQDQYRYDPEKAEQLLDEAGYPRGADGVRFRATHDHRDVIDLGLAEIAAGYFKEIGVEVEIDVYDSSTWWSRKVDALYEMSTGDLGFDAAPEHIIGFARSLGPDTEPHGWNEWFGGTPNATLIRLYNEFQTATSEAELIRIAKEFDQYLVSQHFQVWTGKSPGFQVAHPWVKGWNGETFVHPENYHEVLARLWLDPDLKAEMGF